MRLLPKLVTTAGVVALPCSDRTAEQLVQALLAPAAIERQSQLETALKHDAPFALWALCRGAQSGHGEIRTVSDLGLWLAENAVTQLSAPAEDVGRPTPAETMEQWADLAAVSLVLARLSARIAEMVKSDPQQAYFLGLLHSAPQWMTTSDGPGSPPHRPSPLPAWLVYGLAAIEDSSAEDTRSASGCVALALRLSNNSAPANGNAVNFELSPQDFFAQCAAASQNWRQARAQADLLGALVQKLARLESLEQRFEMTLQTEKLESLKELAYGAGHEINNPLANISARAQTLLQEERDPERRRKLAAINTQAFRAHEMIADMMLFARPPQPKPHAMDLVPLVGEILAELQSTAAQQRTEFVWNPPATAVVAWADRTQIAVVVRALCINALEALVTGGRIEVAASIAEPGSLLPAEARSFGQSAQITVSDNGPGISGEVRRHIFDPFYSGREAGRGLGFGLSKCWRIVTLHGGRIDVQSDHGRGARFTITLPSAGTA
jgi:signal transduction histidine kinase